MQLQTADQWLDNDDDQDTRWTRRPTAAAAAWQGWIDGRDAGWERQIDGQVAAKYHCTVQRGRSGRPLGRGLCGVTTADPGIAVMYISPPFPPCPLSPPLSHFSHFLPSVQLPPCGPYTLNPEIQVGSLGERCKVQTPLL